MTSLTCLRGDARLQMVTSLALLGKLCAVTHGDMKKLTPMSIRLDPEVKAALEERAKAKDRSLSWVANYMLRRGFGLSGKQPAAKKKLGGRSGA